jgi:hypothetical protein
MNVCTVTFYKIPHPGAVLQAYALHRALRTLGHNPTILGGREKETAPGRRSIKQAILRWATNSDRTLANYAAFREKNLPLCEPVEGTHGRLAGFRPEADAFISGSDQVWNANLFPGKTIDPAFLCSFPNSSARRISYAASMGGWAPEGNAAADLKRALEGFHAISVREPGAKALLESLLKRPIEVTLDPTLLFDDYEEISAPPRRAGESVVLFPLQATEGLNDAARYLAGTMKKSITTLGGPLLPWKRCGRRVEADSPATWLGAIRDSAGVVTNSFHGLVFALLARKPVIFVPLTGALAPRNERIRHLCDLLNVPEEIFWTGSPRSGVPEICWDKLSTNLEAHRQQSLDFLSRALT